MAAITNFMNTDNDTDSDPTPQDSRQASKAVSITSIEKRIDIEKLEVSENKGQQSTEFRINDNIPGETQLDEIHDEGVAANQLDPPDGGLQAWLQVLGGHCVILVTWGYINSFGFFQSHYLTALPDSTPSSISWIGSVQLFCLFFIGTFSGQAFDTGYFRPVFLAGSCLLLLGVFMTSFCTVYYQLFLAHGLCVGLGNGLLFVPTTSLIATYFCRNRSIAIAFIASGTAVGGVILPLVIQACLPKLGFRTTIRILGGVIGFFLLVAGSLLRTRLPPRRRSGLIDMTVFRDYPYCLYALGSFFFSFGLFIPFYYVPTYTRIILPRAEAATSSLPTYLLVGMNAIGVPGRIIAGRVADIWSGPLNFMVVATSASFILQFSWLGVKDMPGLYAFTLFYGFFGAAVQTLFTATIASMIKDLDKMGVRSGMIYSFTSFACLTGTPIAGALLQAGGGVDAGTDGFKYAKIFGGLVCGIGALVIGCARQLATGGKWAVKI